MLTAAICFVVILLVAAAFIGNKPSTPASPEQLHFKSKTKIATEYLQGHPQSKGAQPVYLVKEINGVDVVGRNLNIDSPPYEVFFHIPYQSIVSVTMQTDMNIEKSFSLGKFMLIGVYALAWLKKKPVPQAFLVITYYTNAGVQTVVCRNEGDAALQETTSASTAIRQWMSQSPAT